MPQGLRERIDLFQDVAVAAIHREHRRIEAPELAAGVSAFKHVVSRGIHETGAAAQFGHLVVQGAPGQIGSYRVGENQVDVMGVKNGPETTAAKSKAASR